VACETIRTFLRFFSKSPKTCFLRFLTCTRFPEHWPQVVFRHKKCIKPCIFTCKLEHLKKFSGGWRLGFMQFYSEKLFVTRNRDRWASPSPRGAIKAPAEGANRPLRGWRWKMHGGWKFSRDSTPSTPSQLGPWSLQHKSNDDADEQNDHLWIRRL